jgi:hypothetical protein
MKRSSGGQLEMTLWFHLVVILIGLTSGPSRTAIRPTMNAIRHVCRLPCTMPFETKKDNPQADPAKPRSHTVQTLEGWTVHIDDRLLEGPDRGLGERALALLRNRLFAITLVVPADKMKRLQQVPLWLDLTHGKLKSMQYHPSAQWLKENGYDPALAKCVHIPDAAYFSSAEIQFQQPWAVLHELAHAYHDQVLSFDNAEIKAAWQKFEESGKYKSVLHMSGRMRAHYGLTNPMEFFAEMTETYFGMNDFYPFNRAELQRDEPEIAMLIGRMWGVPR